MAFAIHIAILINTILSVIDNCTIGGLGTYFVYSLRYTLLDPVFVHFQSCHTVPVLSL